MAMKTDARGNKKWYNANGKLHRDNDLPAIENANGDKEWYVNEKLHRENNLPAIENADGIKAWCVNGKLHRDNDLPAIECSNGDKYWYADGKIHRPCGLHAIEYAYGCKLWFINGKRYTYDEVINHYNILAKFGRYCLWKIRMRRLRRVRWIHGELLCMPPKGSYPGGQDYHKMVSYFMSLDKN
jgi:hypothetical protein